jgi:16S rRNA processing protein RimM
MKQSEPMIVMAQVVAPYGVQGWLRLRTFSATPEALGEYRLWWLRRGAAEEWTEVAPVATRTHSGTMLARLPGIADRDAAQAMAGAQIAVPRSAMPALDERAVYWADCVGLQVVNRAGAVLGRVEAVQEFGAHPVLRVVPEQGREGPVRLIPFVAAYVDGVDVAAGRIEVDWQPDY